MIKKYLKIYQLFFKNSLMILITHRFDLIMSGVANIVWTVGQLISIRYLFMKISDFKGWTFGDLVLLLAFGQAFFYISWVIYDNNLQRLPRKIITGDLDKILLKPINIKFFVSFREISIPQIGVMLTTVIPLFIYGLNFQDNLTWYNSLLAILILFLGTVLFYFLSLGVSALAFLFDDITSIKYFLFRSSLNLNRIPLTIFPKFIQYVLTFILPLAFLAFYPTKIIKGELSPYLVINLELGLIYLSYLFSSWMWEIGLKNYTSVSK